MTEFNAQSLGRAPAILEYTQAKRREIFEQGKDLFTYCRGILGFEDFNTSLHLPFCRFLHRDLTHGVRRQLVFMFRGGFKSSAATIGDASWRGLYLPNYMIKLVEASSDNAKKNHFKPIKYIFEESSRSDFLYWIYGDYGNDSDVDPRTGRPLDWDMRRIPEGFKGWNNEQLDFLRSDPMALPCLSYGGIDSTYEGWHGHMVLGDDLEGADEDKAIAPNEDAWHFVTNRAVPLFRRAKDGLLRVVGTPHGGKPLVNRIRKMELEYRAANPGQQIWDMWWVPLIGSDGVCAWPEEFPPKTIQELKMFPRMWAMQYQGEESSPESLIFDTEQIEKDMYQWRVPGKLLAYVRQRWAEDSSGREIHDESGYRKIEYEAATLSPYALRPFIHGDPKHVKDPKNSDAEAALVVTATAWDQHAFVLETWSGDVNLEEFAEKLYFLYRKYRPWKVTMGAVGAETWFWDYAKMLERGKYKRIMSLPDQYGNITRLPSLVKRLEPASSHTHMGKDDWIVHQLQSWFSMGLIHLGREHQALLTQLGNCGSGSASQRDLADALAQGPSIWTFPQSPTLLRQQQRLINRRTLASVGADPFTGYFNPHDQKQIGGARLPELTGDRF